MKSTEQGWVKLHRQILEWEWFDDPNTFRLFIYCLLKANHTDKKYMGVTIKRGTFVTSLEELSKDTKLSVRSVRTCLTRLESTNEVTSQRSFKGTVIQVVKYDDYQVTTNQTTTKRQASDKPTTTTKNDKEIKELNIPTWEEFKEYALLKQQNLDTLSLRHKYDAWVELGWCINRKGSLERIINWKTTLLNTLQYIKTVAPDNDLPPLQKNDAVLATRLQAHMDVLKKQGYTEEQIKHYAK